MAKIEKLKNKDGNLLYPTTIVDAIYDNVNNKSLVNALSEKVDKDGSKVLSDNNYTTPEKTKLAATPTFTFDSSTGTLTITTPKIYEKVDLGLPSGLLWANMNLGADTETDYGDYYMFGSVTPDTDNVCDWSHAPFNNGQENYDEAYFNSVKDTVCPNGILAPEFDAATVNMGEGWSMPTQSDLQELIDETNNEWTTINNINGYKFTNKNDSSKYIFIPASGLRDGSDFYYIGGAGDSRSSSLVSNALSDSWNFGFDSDAFSVSNFSRYYGMSVRGVYNPSN